MTMQVELVSPERILFSGEATMVTARTLGGGDIAFLTGHAPFIGALAIDQVIIRLTDGSDEVAAVHGGFVSVSGETVPVAETVESFEAIVNGELDDTPEQAFLNVGGVEQVLAKAKALQEGAA